MSREQCSSRNNVMNSNSNELLTSGLVVDYFVLFHHGVEGEC